MKTNHVIELKTMWACLAVAGIALSSGCRTAPRHSLAQTHEVASTPVEIVQITPPVVVVTNEVRAAILPPTGRVETKALAESILEGWKPRPAEVARQMVIKYGAPHEVTTNRLVWHNNLPWKRTEVVNEEVPHHFPKPHFDILAQTINFRIPAERLDELGQFDGSVVADRTRGELTVRGENEAMNFLTANLANEVLIGARNVRDARQLLTESVRQLKHSDYMTRFLFVPTRLPQGDPGEPIPLP